MKRRHIPPIAIVLVLGLALMSIPSWLNRKMQHHLAEKLALCKSAREYLETRFSDEVQDTSLLQNENFCLARVIFRSPSNFNSFMWVNVGSEDSPIIKKNSPVIQFDSLIGVVEYVGAKASLVRLITDTKMQPAVRVVRNRLDPSIRFAIHALQDAAEDNKLSFRSNDEKTAFMWMLEHCKEQQKNDNSVQFLAKGILQGQGGSLWKQDNCLLKGYGFNYDFKDQHGPARDLRTGSIIEVGDLLVTSGLDGIFPEGLKVAKVHSIKPLTEGSFAYELWAKPSAFDLQDISYVSILEPEDFDVEKMPQHLDLILNQISN